MQTIIEYWQSLDGNQIGALCLALAAVATITAVEIAKRYYKAGEAKMLRKQRVKAIMAEEIQDMLLDLHVRDLLTTSEVNALHIKFAKQFGYWDLYPKKLLQEKPDPTIMAKIGDVPVTRTVTQDTWTLQLGNLLKP